MIVFDTESNGFKYESTVVWVICSYDTDKDTYSFSFADELYQEYYFPQLLRGLGIKGKVHSNHASHIRSWYNQEVVAHNYFQHDKPLLMRLVGGNFFSIKGHDSYILSQLLDPDRHGGHGLGAYGEKFGVPKPFHEDWNSFSEDMLHRVIEDVKINVLTWNYLQAEMGDWDWSQAIELEYAVADIQGRQELHGILVDTESAYELAEAIYKELQEVDEKLLEVVPLRVIPQPDVDYSTKPFTLKGKLKANVLKWFGGEVDVSAPFCRVEFEKLNLNSYEQLKNFLLSEGWQPTEYTEKGSPKLTEDSFDSIEGETGKLIARRGVLKHRGGMVFNINKDGELKGLLNMIRDDGRIEAGAITNATNTGRMAHRNLVNIPKPKDKFKYTDLQIRDLMIVPDGRVMMGADADGLEARMEAHACIGYKGGKEYAHELIDGDIHTKNMAFFGVKDRDSAKPPKYAITYGAQPPKLAETVGCSLAKAKKMFNNFWNGNTALKGFKDDATEQWQKRRKSEGRGYLKGIDGRKIWIRSEHSIVNAYFQSTGSIVVKQAAVLLDKEVTDKKLDAQQVIIYHDEVEYEVSKQDAEVLCELTKDAFKRAGEVLGIKVPTTTAPKLGHNWRQVH